MAQDNREANLVNALSGLVDSYYDIHSNGESCPACGGEYIDDVHGLMSTTHDEDCPLAIAVKLLVPSLNQDTLPVKHCKLCLSIEAGHRGMAMVESYIEDRRNEGVFLITEPSPAGTPFKEVVANCHTPLHRVDGMVRLNPDLGIDSPYGYHFEVTMYDFDHLT